PMRRTSADSSPDCCSWAGLPASDGTGGRGRGDWRIAAVAKYLYLWRKIKQPRIGVAHEKTGSLTKKRGNKLCTLPNYLKPSSIMPLTASSPAISGVLSSR